MANMRATDPPPRLGIMPMDLSAEEYEKLVTQFMNNVAAG